MPKNRFSVSTPVACLVWLSQLFEQHLEKCEGATGSLAIVASDHGPSHPCGVTPRIAIANDAPRGATSRRRLYPPRDLCTLHKEEKPRRHRAGRHCTKHYFFNEVRTTPTLSCINMVTTPAAGRERYHHVPDARCGHRGHYRPVACVSGGPCCRRSGCHRSWRGSGAPAAVHARCLMPTRNRALCGTLRSHRQTKAVVPISAAVQLEITGSARLPKVQPSQRVRVTAGSLASSH